MSFIREISTAIRATLVLWVISAVIYPIFMLLVGQIFPYQANGSLITNAEGKAIGSALIGQNFTADKYFWGRPSTTNYSSFAAKDYNPAKPENLSQRTGVSGASNLAPSNPDLLEQVTERTSNLKNAGIANPTADLVYTSGSSLDPHITPEAAKAQLERVAKARSLSSEQLQSLIDRTTEGRFLGIFGEPGVNVLKLNIAMDNFKA